jgi:hypothetical protein
MLDNNPNFLVGETFIDGQQREVWCNSKIPITDMHMFFYSGIPNKGTDLYTKGTTCFRVYFNNAKLGLVMQGDRCLLNAMNEEFKYVFFVNREHVLSHILNESNFIIGLWYLHEAKLHSTI